MKRLLNAKRNLEPSRIIRINRSRYTVFNQGDFGSNSFRIPTIVKLNNGDLLTFSQVQYSYTDDYVNQDIGMARSIDGGRTWTDKRLIVQTLSKSNRLANPTVIYNEDNGTLVLFATEFFTTASTLWWTQPDNMWDMYVLTSTDNGHSWEKKSIKSDLLNTRPSEYSTAIMAGLGTGVVMDDGTYVVGAEIGYDSGSVQRIENGLIYSTDLVNWQLSSGVTPERGDEANIVLLDNNRLLLNARNYGSYAPKRRKIFETSDLGSTWTPHKTHQTIPENRATMGHTLKLNRQDGNLVLFSHMQGKTATREDLGISVLANDESEWRSVRVILRERYFGYSCMAYNRNEENVLLIAYEQNQNIYVKNISDIIPLAKQLGKGG